MATSALVLVAARLRRVAGMQWGRNRYLDMSHLRDFPLSATDSHLEE